MKNIKSLAMLCITLVLVLSMAVAGTVVYADEPVVTEIAPVAETTPEAEAVPASPETPAENVAETPAADTPAEETPVADAPAAETPNTPAANIAVLPDPVFELVAETDKVALYADKTIGEIKFVDKVSGNEWFSNPQDKSSTTGVEKDIELLYSQFALEYGNPYEPAEANSYRSSLRYTRAKKTPCLSAKMFNKLAGFAEDAGRSEIQMCQCLSYDMVDGGIKFTYTMPDQGFKVVLQYVVKNDYLEASILTNESILSSVKMTKQVVNGFQTRIAQENYSVTKIDLLPLFGAGSDEENGYMLLPDESGVIVDFNNGKNNYDEYDMPVYGRYYETREYARRQPGVYMPVFGTVKENGTLMGVITEGEAVSFIKAYVSGTMFDFNNAYSAAQICVIEKNVGETEGIPYAKSIIGDQNYTVRYYSMDAANGGYVGMANKYRDYLIKEEGMKKSDTKDSAVFLDVYGQVTKDKNILGVPVEMPESLTSYSEVVTMMKTLKTDGIESPTVRYTSWQDVKNEGSVATKVKTSGYLGGNGDYKDMLKYMKDNNIKFYPNIDYVNFSKGNSKYSKFDHAIKKADQSPVTVTRSRIPLKLGTKWYLLKPATLKEGVATWLKDYVKESDNGIAIDSIANMVYSDFSKGSSVRAETANVWKEVLKNAQSTTGSLMVDQANAYAFPYADAILTTPTTDAYCKIADRTVPFYQMVLHGYVNYGTEAVNLSADPETLRLKGIETGAALTYSVFYSPASDIKGTYMDYLFSSNFGTVKKTIKKYYDADKSYYEKINGKMIVNHEFLADGVAKTTFEGGTSVVVNYNDTDVTLPDGTTVKAMNYILQ